MVLQAEVSTNCSASFFSVEINNQWFLDLVGLLQKKLDLSHSVVLPVLIASFQHGLLDGKKKMVF